MLPGHRAFWGDAYAGVSCRVQLGAPPEGKGVGLAVVGVVGGEGVGAVELLYEYELGEAVREGEAG